MELLNEDVRPQLLCQTYINCKVVVGGGGGGRKFKLQATKTGVNKFKHVSMRQFEMLIKLLWPVSLTTLNQTLLACCELITWLCVGQQ